MTSLIFCHLRKWRSVRKIHTLLNSSDKISITEQKEFPHKSWSRSGLNKIIRKIDRTGTSKRLPDSGRPRTARTSDKI